MKKLDMERIISKARLAEQELSQLAGMLAHDSAERFELCEAYGHLLDICESLGIYDEVIPTR